VALGGEVTGSTAGGFYVGDDANPEKYRLVRQVGRGGEATLWLGGLLVEGGEEKVAIKILHPDHADDFERLRDRWSEQVETLRFVSDPNVVAVRDWFVGPPMHRRGEQPPSRGRALYLAMNWVEGQPFRDWVALHEGRAGWLSSLSKLSQVARALDDLHAGRAIPSGRPVTHGDLSPGNVMITPEEQAILVDFGLVRLAEHQTSRVMATAGFAAPEVLAQGRYGPAADRYGFAALGYFSLLGEAPPADIGAIHRSLFSHAQLRNAPPARVAAIMSGFDPDPQRRPGASAWLEAFRDGATTSSRNTMAPVSGPLPTRPSPPPAPVPQPAPRPYATAAPAQSSSRGLLVAAGVVVLVLLVIVVALLASRGSNGGGTVATPTLTPVPTLPGTTALPTVPGGSGPAVGTAPATPTYTGSIRLTSDGVGVTDGRPDSKGYPVLEWSTDNTVYGSYVTSVAQWPSTADATSDQCVAQLGTQAYSSVERQKIPFQPGLGLCYETASNDGNHYIVFLRLPRSSAQPAIQVQATIWRKPTS
jgi:serine/threonine protein kinase